jgi:hypothetical protein
MIIDCFDDASHLLLIELLQLCLLIEAAVSTAFHNIIDRDRLHLHAASVGVGTWELEIRLNGSRLETHNRSYA